MLLRAGIKEGNLYFFVTAAGAVAPLKLPTEGKMISQTMVS